MRKTVRLSALFVILGFTYACQQSVGGESKLTEINQQAANQEPQYWLLTDPTADLYNYIRTTTNIDNRTKLLIYNARQKQLLIYDTEKKILEKKIQYDH